MQQVMAGQLATRFLQQTLKRNALLGEPPLQCPNAQMQLSCEVLYPWAVAGKQLLQNRFSLFAEGFLRELLREFRFKLRRDNREQLRVGGDKGQVHIRFAEYQRILVGLELYRTVKMRFVNFSVYWNSLELHSFRTQRPSSASAGDGNDPCETHVNQERRLLFVREKPDELDRAFISSFNQPDFLWTGQLFVAREPL